MNASVVTAHRLSSCGSKALERGLRSLPHGLHCSMACGIFPDQGANPALAGRYPLHQQGSPMPSFSSELLCSFCSEKVRCWVEMRNGVYDSE